MLIWEDEINGQDLLAFVEHLEEQELRALVNHSPGAAAKEGSLLGQEVYRELVCLCADELARRWRTGRLPKANVVNCDFSSTSQKRSNER